MIRCKNLLGSDVSPHLLTQLLFICLLPLFLVVPLYAQTDSTIRVVELVDISLEDLLKMKVTSVNKQTQQLNEIPASVYVINQEDIRRSGATRIQDLLKMVPGLFIASENYDDVDFGIRDKADYYDGTVLVLLNNVPMHSPYISSFDFSNFDIDFNSIDRIEVIKGPGGTIYGANAATGVVSIFTKKPEETTGIQATLITGSRGLLIPTLRYGKVFDEKTSLNVWGKFHNFNGFEALDQFNGNRVTVAKSNGTGDTTIANHVGADVYQTKKFSFGGTLNHQVNDRLSITGNIWGTLHDKQRYIPSYLRNSLVLQNDNSKWFVASTRLDYKINEKHDLFVQLSLNSQSESRIIQPYTYSVWNFEFQDNIKLRPWTSMSYGIVSRTVDFSVLGNDTVNGFYDRKPYSTYYLNGIFLQEQFFLLKNKIHITAGTKAEQWTLVNRSIQLSPSLKMAYLPASSVTFWGGISRSVATPSYLHKNIAIEIARPQPGVSVAVINPDNIEYPVFITTEFGIKGGRRGFNYELTAFYVQADGKINYANGTLPVSSPFNNNQIIPVYLTNARKSQNLGLDAVLKFRVSTLLTIETSYSYLQMAGQNKNLTSLGVPYESYTNPSIPLVPNHIARLRLYFRLPRKYEFTVNGIYQSAFSYSNQFSFDTQRPPNTGLAETGLMPDIRKPKITIDIKIEKKLNKSISLFGFCRDLLNSGTVEIYTDFVSGVPMQTQRYMGAGFNFTMAE